MKISCGGYHTVLLSNMGRIYTCGLGSYGQLGLKNTKNQSQPCLVYYLIGKNFFDIAAGWHHSLIISDRGDVYACGYNNNGQL